MINEWKDSDSPFCFVAACRELASAWKSSSDKFDTHLPIGFDGSNNGLQHLAMIARDPETAYWVNIGPKPDALHEPKLLGFNRQPRCEWPRAPIWPTEPQDIYKRIIAATRELLAADGDDKFAAWWVGRLKLMKDREIRKLLKTPALSYNYGVSASGMAKQIAKVYRDDLKQFEGLEPRDDHGVYLGLKIIQACERELKVPTAIMHYIRAVAAHCLEYGWAVECPSPTGFPFINRKDKPNIKQVRLLGSGGSVTHEVGDGWKDEIAYGDTLDAIVANFIHSLDASHLIRSINSAVRAGITNTLTVHDCYYNLAPQVVGFGQILRDEMAMMYTGYDPLRRLRDLNISDPQNLDLLPLPPYGKYDPSSVRSADFAFA